MTSAFDDEDLALSINPSHTRRGSARSPGEQSQHGRAPLPPHIPPPPTHSLHKAAHRLGEYDIIKTLGEGSFGKVKLAVHHRLGHKVALKIISRKSLMGRDMQGRVEREIQYLQLLRHPHIIKLYTVITTPTEIIMVLEYAGSELFNYIVEHGKLQEDKARQFFQQIVCAVEYCHRHKIVHRDLKPENLLLDDQLHVKIADFGLSNIMTDGNFLKTSCGSPNYAAPEVISGKLYAGPEVDVWSCGVILYVLLVGKLPFDDEYIPTLFRMIAQGSYHMPSYLSAGASRLIRKMLQVSPVLRITVQEIRQDPWFTKNLPDYLQPPVEEFVDTGVDPNKAIDPRSLAPNKSAAVVEKLHNSVVGKLGKTLGYGREDVQQALAVDEPNAIKDAYLIVRENQIMRETPSLVKNPNLQPFLAQSPPSLVPHIPSIVEESQPQAMQLAAERPRHGSIAGSTSASEGRASINTIAVLPSSLPDYHRAFMTGHPKASTTAVEQPKDSESSSGQTKEQQAETARRLKPHTRNSHQGDKNSRPDGMTPLNPAQKKPKPTKWQFGIRSRNQPAEAMLAIYKALRAMGAEWEVPKIRKPGPSASGGSEGDSSRDDEGSGFESSSGSEDEGGHDHSEDEGEGRYHTERKRDSITSSRGRGRSRYGSWNDWGYTVPQDPWIINARFRKHGMYPLGMVSSLSANSSRVDLREAATSASRQRASSSTSVSTTENPASSGLTPHATARASQVSLTSSASVLRGTDLSPEHPVADDAAYVYMTIQLYSIEKEFYLVDFRCAGYERLVRRLVREVGSGMNGEDGSGDENDEEDMHRTGHDIEIGGLPREGGRWDALAKRSSNEQKYTSKRNQHANGHHDHMYNREDMHGHDSEGEGYDDDDNDGVSRSGIRLREEVIGDGRAIEEKDVSSPFPFLDVASRLIIQLAEAD